MSGKGVDFCLTEIERTERFLFNRKSVYGCEYSKDQALWLQHFPKDDREESHAADPIPSLSYGLYGGIAHICVHDREESHAWDPIPSLSLRKQGMY